MSSGAAGKTVGHDYDPKIMFHSFTSNLPHLQSWIDELIALHDSALPKHDSPSADLLVQSLQRYDVVYKELLRQTKIFSEPITRMLAQVWSGSMGLMVYMIKSYHRYVKHTSHLQTQAQSLLSERQRGEAANKVQKEEFELERTALRAQIRNYESEAESLRMSKRFLEKENNKLRKIIDVYIRSAELNDPVWDVMKSEDFFHSTSSTNGGGKKDVKINVTSRRGGSSESHAAYEDMLDQGFRRKDVIDAGKTQLKTLNRLDIEINEVLANILKEENRQRLLMKDVMRLIGKNKELFLVPVDPLENEEEFLDDENMNKSEDESAGYTSDGSMNAITAPLLTKQNLVDSAIGRSSVDVLKASFSSPSSTTHKKSMRGIVSRRSSEHANNAKRRASVVINMKRLSFLSSFGGGGGVTRGLVETSDVGIQIDGKDEFSLRLNGPEDNLTIEDILNLGVAPLAPMNVFVPGLDVPFQLRARMQSFPAVLRVPPVAWTCQTILAIYLDLLQPTSGEDFLGGSSSPKVVTIKKTNNSAANKRKPSATVDYQLKPLPDQVYDYFLRVMGLSSAADVQIAQLLRACEAHINKQTRISLFASQIGLLQKDNDPPMDRRDTAFILQVLRLLIAQGELQSELQRALQRRGADHAHVAVHIKPEISRNVAASVTHELFHSWLPDGGEDFVIKIKTMQGSSEGGNGSGAALKFVDLDRFLEVLIEPWHAVRRHWEEHAQHMFKERCNIYRVLQEAAFANDEGVKACDTILVEMNRAGTMDCYRRPLRLFMASEDDAPTGVATSAAPTSPTNKVAANVKGQAASTQGNVNIEPVVELMNRKKFTEAVLIIHPTLDIHEVDDMFDEAVEMMHAKVMRKLQVVWRRFIDRSANYFTNSRPVTQASMENNARASILRELEGFLPVEEEQAETNDGYVPRSPAHRQLGTNREFFVNTNTMISQWTRPFFARTFRAQDIDAESFVTVLILHDIFPRSPMLELLNLPPKDLWSNADMFWKQLKEKQRKQGTGLETKELQQQRKEQKSTQHVVHAGSVRFEAERLITENDNAEESKAKGGRMVEEL